MNRDYIELLHRTLPELALVLTAFAVLGVDLASRGRSEGLARLQNLGRLTLIGLVAAAALTVHVSSLEPSYFDADAMNRRLAGQQVLPKEQAVSHWKIPETVEKPADFYPYYAGMLASNHLSTLLKFVIIALTVLMVIIAMEREFTKHVGEFFAVTLFGAMGMMLLISAEELIMIFVALELTSISLYIMTAFHKGSLRSAEAAMKYFIFGGLSSAFLLFGLSWIYGVTGETSLVGIRQVIAERGLSNNMILLVGIILSTVGFGFKVAVVPFHLWAPDAYEGAPTPVTAFIATGSKVASFVVAAKFLVIAFPLLAGSAFWSSAKEGWVPVLAALASLSMIVGNCAAIVQKNVKRLLAYSSIAHAGYIFVGLIAAGAADSETQKMGMSSLLFYVVTYALTTLGAFGVVHAMEEQAGGGDLKNFDGMSQRAPFLSLLLLVFILSLAGVPPLAGFFGKFYVFAAAVKVQASAESIGLLWLVWIAILTSAVSLYYYLILLKHVYVHGSQESSRVESSTPMRVAMGLACLGVVLLGVFPTQLLDTLHTLLVFVPR